MRPIDAVKQIMELDTPVLVPHLRTIYDRGAVTAPCDGWSTGTPKEIGWYLVYAPTYKGGSSTSREHHAGVMFAKWSGKAWSIERCCYNRPGCVLAWMSIPQPPNPMKEGETNES